MITYFLLTLFFFILATFLLRVATLIDERNVPDWAYLAWAVIVLHAICITPVVFIIWAVNF